MIVPIVNYWHQYVAQEKGLFEAQNLEMLALTAHSLNQPNDTLGFANRYLKLGEPDKNIDDVREWAVAQILKH